MLYQFSDYSTELDQLRKETLTFRRSYVPATQIEAHPAQWQLHLGKLHSLEKRFELLRFDLYQQLNNAPDTCKLAVLAALSEFLFAHSVADI